MGSTNRKRRERSKPKQGRSKFNSEGVESGSVQIESNPQQKLLDLLVLPELAFSGNWEKLSTYAEPTSSGPTSMWAHAMSLKYDCPETVGYPERPNPVTNTCYNSAITVYSTIDSGEPAQNKINYRQTQLDHLSRTWASSGKGFWNGKLPGLGEVTMGIGWDVMPQQDDLIFANHILKNKSDLVILPMNILSLVGHEGDSESFLKLLCKNLWPIVSEKRETIVVAANRCGTQGKYAYAGSSAVLGLGNGLVRIYNALDCSQRSLLVVDTLEAPIFIWDETDIFSQLGPQDATINKVITKDDPIQPCGSEEILSPISPSPSTIPQAIYDQQIIKSRLNNSMRTVKILKARFESDCARRQESLGEIRYLTTEKLSLMPVIRTGLVTKMSEQALNQLIEINRYVDKVIRLVKDLDEKNKSLNLQHIRRFDRVIEFLRSIEIFSAESMVLETGSGNE